MTLGEIRNEREWLKMIVEEEKRASENKINKYTCYGCAAETVTVDSDNGTTPFQIPCPKCGKSAVSALYRVSQDMKATHEFYRPSFQRFQNLHPAIKQHVGMGGLLLRRIGEF
jgi:hypothetical protein